MPVELVGMTTKGDQILDVTLSKIGGKGLFVKELELALMEHRADLAVHSLKDVPMVLPEGFELAAVMKREDPRDCFVSPKFDSLESLPAGSKVGTSSLRRELMLRSRYPHLKVEWIRGNVGTRLSKLDRGDYDGLVMATAGLKRLGLSERIRQIIPTEISLPSPGQGALGIEIRANDPEVAETVAFLNDVETRLCCSAERAVSQALGGSCQVPLAAYATVEAGEMTLRTLVGNHKSGEFVTAVVRGKAEDALDIARQAVESLKAQGAERLLKEVLG
jgi:hydroxymethylbilane synthase